MNTSDSSDLDEILRHLIETAYQDMEGVLGGRKGYRLRHNELADKTKQAILSNYRSISDIKKALGVYEPLDKQSEYDKKHFGHPESDGLRDLQYVRQATRNSLRFKILSALNLGETK